MDTLLFPVLAAVFGYLWWRDYRRQSNAPDATNAADAANEADAPLAPLMPGATPCAGGFIALATLAGVALTLAETGAEYALGVAAQQKALAPAAFAALLAAPVVEEIVFRGYLVVEGRGRAVLAASVVFSTLLFAAGHDFLWHYEFPAGAPWHNFWRGFSADFSTKGLVSFAFALAAGLCFCALRLHPRNRARSLLPCFAAHAARNLAVAAAKLAQGFVAPN